MAETQDIPQVDNQEPPPQTPQQPPDNVKALYDAVSHDYDLGDFNTFKAKLQDPKNQEAFYNSVGKDYDLGTIDEFKTRVSGNQQQAPTTHQPTTAELWNTGIQQDLHQKAVATASTELPKVISSPTYRKAAEKINATNLKNQLTDLQARFRDGTITQDEYNQKESEIESANFDAKNDVANVVAQSAGNEPLMRRLLAKTSDLHEDKNPQNAGKLEKQVYLLDSKDRGYNAQEILDNADKIEKRELKYDIANKRLLKPDGNPFVTAYKAVEQRNKDMDLFNYFSQASPTQAAITLRGMQKSNDPDKPTDKASGFWGNVGEMVGGNLVPLVGGAASGSAAALVGGPEAAPVGAATYNSIEMGRRAWINSFMSNANDLINKGADPEDAVTAAKSKANVDAGIDAATGALMGYLGTKAGMSPKYSPLKLSDGYKNVLTTIAKNVGKFGVATTPEGGLNALLAAGGQGLKNINDGKNPQEGTTEAAMSMLLLHYSLAGVGALKKTGLTPEAYEQNLNGIAKLPPDKVTEAIHREVLSGGLTQDQANEKMALIQEQRDLNNGLQNPDIPQENKEKIKSLKDKRDELEWQIHKDNPNQVDKAFHKEIKEKIDGVKKTNADGTTEGSDGINEQIRQLSKGEKAKEEPKVFVDPMDRAKELINEKAVNGKIGNYDVSDPEELLKHIAEQAHGGSMLDDKFISTRPLTEETFGKELTDIATKTHPEHIIQESKTEEVDKGKAIVPNSDKIAPTKDFQTWDIGDMAGKPEDDAAKKHLEGVVRDWNTKPAGTEGETFGEFINRVIPSFDKVLKEEPNNSTVVTHSSVLKAFKVWDEMGRPDVNNLTPEQKTEFANQYNKEETQNADLDTFKGANGDIHVIRHGQTEDNAKNNFRSGDTNLTEKGINQAKEVGQQLKEKTGGDVPKIITSDLPRAIHTSNLITDELNNNKTQDNAVQQQAANEVGVRNETAIRSGVGGQDTKSKEPSNEGGRSGSGQSSTEEKGKTEEEKDVAGSDLSGIKNDISRPERAQRKLPEVELPKMGSDTDILNEGKKLVDSGKINPRELVNRINSDPTSTFTPNEAKAMQYYMRQLKTLDTSLRQELASATDESHKIDVRSQLGQLDDEMDAATEANLKGGNDWGQIGNIRQIVVDEGFNPSRQKAAIKDAYAGEVPKDAQLRIDAAFKERDAALEEKNKLEEALKQKQAELNTEKMKKAADRLQRDEKRTKTKEQLKTEEKTLLDDLKKAFKRDLGNAHAGIPIPVGTVEALGKLAINYLRQGVNDLGGIIDKIHDNIKDEVEGITKQDIRDLLARYKPLETEAYIKDVTKLEKKAENLESKPKNQTTPPKREKLLFEKDTRWMKANQRVINAEYKIKQEKQKAYNSKQNWFQKTLGWANHLFRLSILSGKTVLAKLSAQATIGSLAFREPESFMNEVWSSVIPKIGEKADIEGYYNARANAKFYSEFFNAKKFAESAVEIAKTGSSALTKERENVIYEHTPVLDLPTDLHAIIKDPPKRAAYEWALEHVLTNLEKKGIDINNPLILEGAKDRAFARAKYEIFLEDNSVSRKFAEWEAENRAGGNIGAVKSFMLHFVFPVSKVPTNIARRIGAHVAGIPMGAYKAREAFSKGIDNLSPDEANQIIRLLSKGSIGWALFGIGLYGAHKVFGGVYNKEIKDKKGKLQPSELGKNKMLIGSDEVPEPVQHAIPLQVMQLGATYRIIHDHYKDAGAGSLESNFKAAIGSTAAVASNIPVVETPMHLAGALFNEPGERKKFTEDMKRRVQPQILRETGVIKPEPKTSELGQK